MGKDYKQKANAKYNHGLIEWEDVPEGLKKMADRHNFDVGEHRAEKIKRAEKASKKNMKRELEEYNKQKEEE